MVVLVIHQSDQDSPLVSSSTGRDCSLATSTQTPKIPQQMHACQIVEFNKPHQIRNIPTPQAQDLKPNDLLLKVAAAGLCHSDVEYLKGTFPIKLPVTGSHKGTETVIAKGSKRRYFQHWRSYPRRPEFREMWRMRCVQRGRRTTGTTVRTGKL